MNPAMHDELEAAAFASWPALEPEEMFCGWRLRYANGYTKRANSANCSAAAIALDDAQIAEIEARYRLRGLPPIFRLTSVAVPSQFDRRLAERGYQLVDPSHLMVLPRLDAAASGAGLRTLGAEDWLAAYLQITGSLAQGQDHHLKMLRAIDSPRVLAIEGSGDEPASCGLAVLHGGRLGLFDLATTATRRRQGWATTLCRKLLAWGQAAGARSAYLQVVANNADAISLYEQLGFQRAYRYWYRVAT